MRSRAVIFALGSVLLGQMLAGQTPVDQTPGERAWKVLDHGLHEGNPLKRMQAVIAMVIIRPESRPVSMLEEALADKERGVREAACATLGQLKAREAIPKLQMALDDSAPEVIYAAAKALYAMNDPMGREVLMEIVMGEQSGASGFVSSSIHGMRLKMHDPKALLMLGVNGGAGALGPFGMGVPLAEGLFKDNQAAGKTAAVLLLATDTTQESIQTLKEALSEKNWQVRAAAARAIATRGATALYDDVAMLLDDKREEAGYSAAAALIRLKQPVPKNRTARPKA
jgi:HEAT repeat protein